MKLSNSLTALASFAPLLATLVSARAEARHVEALSKRDGLPVWGAFDFTKGNPYTQIVLAKSDGAADNGEIRLDFKNW